MSLIHTKTASFLLVSLAMGVTSSSSAGVVESRYLAAKQTADTTHQSTAAQQQLLINPSVANGSLVAAAPVWLEQIVKGSNITTQSQFGAAVAVEGDIAMVGAVEKSALGSATGAGAVYVFQRVDGVWVQVQKLFAADGVVGDEFGVSIALHDDVVLIGAQRADIAGAVDQGAVYVFGKAGGIWIQTQKLTPASAAAQRMFAAVVTMDGSSAMVGTPCGMFGEPTVTCPVYALRESGGIWSITQELHSNDYQSGDIFGYHTSLRGDTALIGAPGVNAAQGAAYVFKDVAGVWTQQQKLVPGAAGMAGFGWDVALTDGLALIGAPFASVGGNAMQGAAYVFERNAGQWLQAQRLTNADTGASDQFAAVVEWMGDRAVMGTPWITQYQGVQVPGAIWLYTPQGGDGLVEEAVLLPSDMSHFPSFAFNIATSGNTVLTGAPIDGLDGVGEVYFYTDGSDGIFADGFDAQL